MSRTIRITLDGDSINRAIEELTRYKQDLWEKNTLFLTKIATEATQLAQERYDSLSDVAYDTDGEPTSVTYLFDSNNKISITAHNSHIGFIEYGAGNLASGEPAPFPTTPDSWSSEHAKQYHRFHKWHHNGREYSEVPPAMVMSNDVYNNIVDNVRKVGKEEFSR